jgi:hypothetical protein
MPSRVIVEDHQVAWFVPYGNAPVPYDGEVEIVRKNSGAPLTLRIVVKGKPEYLGHYGWYWTQNFAGIFKTQEQAWKALQLRTLGHRAETEKRLAEYELELARIANGLTGVDAESHPEHCLIDMPDGGWRCTCTDAGLDFCAVTQRLRRSGGSANTP